MMDSENWWGGKDQQLQPALPPPLEWGYLPNSPLSGRRTGRRPASQEYEKGTRPKTAPAWSGSNENDWDMRHHISFSRNNLAFPSSLREYFPSKPKVPMARKSMHPESFVPLAHVSGKPCLFQRPPPADASHTPKFSADIWRQADPYLDDEASVTGMSVTDTASSQSGKFQGGHTSRKTPSSGEVSDQWDDRASTSISRHNGRLHSNQREYFFLESSSFSSPPEFYHNQKWRHVRKTSQRDLIKYKSKRKNVVVPERNI